MFSLRSNLEINTSRCEIIWLAVARPPHLGCVRELFLAKNLLVFCDPLVLPKVPLRYDFFTPIVPLPSSEDDFLKIHSLYTRLFPPLPNAATWSV